MRSTDRKSIWQYHPSLNDVLVLLIIPAFYLNDSFGLMFTIFVIYRIVTADKKAEKDSVVSPPKDANAKTEEEREQEMRVLSGLDVKDEQAWFMDDDYGDLKRFENITNKDN